VGTLFTCVSNVECDVVWTYRGSLDACATVTFTVYDATGAEVASDEVANGEGGASASVAASCDRDDFREILTGETMRNRHRHAR
jgi:hypothetical protein